MAETPRSNPDLALLIDVSRAGNSARACQLVDEFITRLSGSPAGSVIDLNAGDLLLTRGVLLKIKQQVQLAGAILGTVYASLPQTQQAALDEGLYVKEKLTSQWAPIRQPLPGQSAAPSPVGPGSTPAKTAASRPVLPPSKKVDLPDFRHPRPLPAKAQEDFMPVAPQNKDIPEISFEIEPATEIPVEPEQPILVETELPQEITDSDTGLETLYVRQTLRSGQTVRFNGNVVIVGDVHAGSEVTAGGDILVWGELRGIAHAGAQGNYKSEIRAMKIEALQLRIADYIARRPDRIYYHKDGVESIISPETARVADGEIKIFKTMLPR